MMRTFTILASVLSLGSTALAQPVTLAEAVAPGNLTKCTLELELKGELVVIAEKGKETLPLQAKARHLFTERVLEVAEGLPSSTARYYSQAVASAVVVVEKHDRTLPDDRRLVIARRNSDGLFCFSPAGTLTQDTLDLITEHFNPQCLPGLLPGKAVAIGDTWPINDTTAQVACLFDALVKAQLTGKLTELQEDIATFTIEGTAEGLENGAKVQLVVNAKGTFNTKTGLIASLVWKQKDQREQGPVNPASQVDVMVTLKREPVAERPKELNNDQLDAQPGAEVPAKLAALVHTDPKGRYQMQYAREWYMTGQTDSHLVLRFLDKGDFLAQATVTAWAKVPPGQHTSIEDFKKAVNSAPGWTPTKVLTEGELPTVAGRWCYRLAVEGKMDELPVVQTFYLLAGPQGDQVAVTIAMTPEKVKAFRDRDAALIDGLQLGKK